MARGFIKLNARRTPEPDDLRAVLRQAERIENEFAAKVAARIRGSRD